MSKKHTKATPAHTPRSKSAYTRRERKENREIFASMLLSLEKFENLKEFDFFIKETAVAMSSAGNLKFANIPDYKIGHVRQY